MNTSSSGNASSVVDLKSYNEVTYEKKGDVHGVSHKNEDGSTGWTPVVGKKKKRIVPEGFLRRLPPEARLRYSKPSTSDSDSSDQDLDDVIPSNATVTFSFNDDVPGLSIETRNTRQWTQTRAKLKT